MFVFPFSTFDILLLMTGAVLEQALPHLALLGLAVGAGALARRAGQSIKPV